MSLSDAALPVRAEHDTLAFTFDDRHRRVRGLENQLSCERLKVNLLVSRQDLTHIDTVDLYTSRQRRMFLREAERRKIAVYLGLPMDELFPIEAHLDNLSRQMGGIPAG